MTEKKISSTELIKKHEYQTMPWKNGKGISSEIAIYPKTAKFPNDPFLWRLSSAKITESGLFSQFPGYDRVLTLVDGNQIDLSFGTTGDVRILNKGDVIHFSGDIDSGCTLSDSAVTDLNLIFKRDSVRARCEIIHISKKPRSFHLEGRWILIFSISGEVMTSVYPGEFKFMVRQHDTLQIDMTNLQEERSEMVLLEPKNNECTIIVVELDW